MKNTKSKKPLPLIREESRPDIGKRVTGGLIVNAVDNLKECPTLIADDFIDPVERQIFETINELVRVGKPCDEAAIMAAVNLPGAVLERYVETAAGLNNIGHYATQLHGMGECDRLIKRASSFIKTGDAIGLSQMLQDHSAQMPCREVATVASDWLKEQDDIIQSIVEGLFDARNRLAIVAQSKMRKSWFVKQLAISLVSGTPFLGMKVSGKKRVLLVNGEIDSAPYKKRLRMMLQGAHVAPDELEGLIICNTSEDASEWTVGRILAMAKAHHVDVVIVDPFYLLIDDEIDQKQVKEAIREMKRFASEGIALVSVFHATKGNIGDKQVIDRIAGSGIFARDCSTLISLCAHATETDHYVMSCEIRNYAPKPPTTLVFEEGCFHLADGVAAIEKNSTTRPPRKFELPTVARCIDKPMTYGQAVASIKQSQAIGDNKAKELLSEMVVKDHVKKETEGSKVYYRFNEV